MRLLEGLLGSQTTPALESYTSPSIVVPPRVRAITLRVSVAVGGTLRVNRYPRSGGTLIATEIAVPNNPPIDEYTIRLEGPSAGDRYAIVMNHAGSLNVASLDRVWVSFER